LRNNVQAAAKAALTLSVSRVQAWTFDSDFGYDFDGALLFTMGPLCRFAFIYLEGHFKAQLCCRYYF
jgi:hypothetical protein